MTYDKTTIIASSFLRNHLNMLKLKTISCKYIIEIQCYGIFNELTLQIPIHKIKNNI